MRRFFTVLILSCPFISSAQNQRLKLNEHEIFSFENNSGKVSSLVIDTLDQYLLRAGSAVLHTSQQGGFAMGTGYFYYFPTQTNQPISTETAMHFDAVGNATVTEVIVWFGSVTIDGTPDFISAKVYSSAADSMPVTQLGTLSSLTTDLITAGTTPTWTSFAFTPPVAITSAFLASIMYQNNDTVGIVGSANGDGLGEQRLRQKVTGFLGGQWMRPTEVWANLDADAFIIPIVDVPAGVNEFANDLFRLKPVYPSLATHTIHLQYSLEKNIPVSYSVFDLTGKVMIEIKDFPEPAGNYVKQVDISGLPSGKYYLTFSAGGKKITQRFVKAE